MDWGASGTGFKELEAKLESIAANEVRKQVRSAMSAGAKILKQAIKDRVPSQYKDARRAIGSTVKVNGEECTAKVGGAVGIKKERMDRISSAMKERRGKKKRRGVGIGARNIHWLILGTNERFQNSKTIGKTPKRRSVIKVAGKPRHPTGRMPAMGVVQAGWKASEAQVEQTIKSEFQSGISAAQPK